MNKLTAKIAIVTLAMGACVCSWALNPCQPIAMQCMKMGYYKGGDTVGKGLVKDCVLQVVSNNKTLPNTNFSQTELQQCNAMIQQRMKNRQ